MTHVLSIRFHARAASLRGLSALGLLALMGLAAAPASAQTLTFDTLPTEQGPTTDVSLTTADGGSRAISGVTFNAAANSDWEIIGSQYQAPSSSTVFAQSHSGAYALAGNAYSGMDFFGNTFTGLSVSTGRLLKSLYVGFDDNGGGSPDAGALTVTAFGAGGDLAHDTVTLGGPALSLVDTSGLFGGLTGVTGYRFETTASNALYAAEGQAYLIADDLTFGAPVPEASPAASLGLLLAGGGLALAARRKKARA